jgi:PPP family 3-phenylpropionic acid transporter
VPLRLALFYAAFFPTLGIYIPFLPSYLAGKDMTAAEIGFLLGAIQISRLIGNPLIARAADAWGEARRPLILLTSASLLGFALFLVIEGFGGLLVLCLALGLVFTAVGPLTDSLAVSSAIAAQVTAGMPTSASPPMPRARMSHFEANLNCSAVTKTLTGSKVGIT